MEVCDRAAVSWFFFFGVFFGVAGIRKMLRVTL